MSNKFEPFVGDWYRNIEGKTFEVVAIDESGKTVEIQYFDGDLAELDLEDWRELEIIAIDEPEDWSGPYDNIVADDYGDTDSVMHPEEWGNPLGELDRGDY